METVILLGIVFLAFVVETVVGFGATVLTVSLAAQLYPIPALLSIFVPVNLLLSSYLVLKYRALVDWKLLCVWILPLMLAGMGLGMWVSHHTEPAGLKPFFGLFVMVLAAVELWRSRGAVSQERTPVGTVGRLGWLFSGGVIHGVFATGGPLVVYVVSRLDLDKQRFRATLSALWCVLNLVLLGDFVRAGRLDAHSLTTSAMLCLPLLAGLQVGEWVHHRVDGERFRTWVYVILFGAGSALVVNALRNGLR